GLRRRRDKQRAGKSYREIVHDRDSSASLEVGATAAIAIAVARCWRLLCSRRLVIRARALR
ncbi:MAG: hypothetical protein V3S87_10130, partial [Alphaproteobacteria bacterium]